MSIVIAFKSSEFSILITDTRLCKIDASDQLMCDDSAIKMRYIDKCGFLAGVGLGELIYGMHNHLVSNTEISIIRPTLRRAFIETYKELFNTAKSDEVKQWLDRTGICVTWIEDEPQLRVFNKNITQDFFVDVKENKPLILFPDDLTEEYKNSVNMSIQSMEVDIKSVLNVLLNTFKEISSRSDYVSNIGCVGIIFSKIVEPIFYKDDVDQLITYLQDNIVLNNSFPTYRDKLISKVVL